MDACFIFQARTLTEGRCSNTGASSLHLNYLTLMKPRTHCKAVLVSIRVEVKRAVKVKAYKRIRRGKVEKVRTHYRKY